LEDLESANKRQAPIVAEVVGYGESFDAYSIMQIGEDTNQIERMLRNTIADAGLKTHDIDYINAHGTGTINNDDIEAKVLRKMFGQAPLVNSTKSLVGHSIGASGALETIVTALSLKHQTTHACKNLNSPNSDLNFVTCVNNFTIKNAITQSFAFGGHNSALALSKYND
jgi:3-oxoacyl-[acyl-carrier-protein] synthase II